MACSDVFRLGAAHETVSKGTIVDCVLREEVPPVVLAVACATLRWIGARVANVPDMAMEVVRVHGLAYAGYARVLKARHHLAIEGTHTR